MSDPLSIVKEGLVVYDALSCLKEAREKGPAACDFPAYKEKATQHLSPETQTAVSQKQIGMTPKAVSGLTPPLLDVVKNLGAKQLTDRRSDTDLEALLKNEALIRREICERTGLECPAPQVPAKPVSGPRVEVLEPPKLEPASSPPAIHSSSVVTDPPLERQVIPLQPASPPKDDNTIYHGDPQIKMIVQELQQKFQGQLNIILKARQPQRNRLQLAVSGVNNGPSVTFTGKLIGPADIIGNVRPVVISYNLKITDRTKIDNFIKAVESAASASPLLIF